MFENIRLRNLFSTTPPGNDLPEQDGITGNLRIPPFGSDDTSSEDEFNQNLMQSIPRFGKAPNMSAAPQEEDDITSMVNSIYTPEHAAADRLSQMIDQFPQRNHPSILRRIAAIAAGGLTQNPQLGEQVMHKPYYDQLNDWKLKLGPIQAAATLERYNNANERVLAHDTATERLKSRDIKRKEEHDEATESAATERNRIAEENNKNRLRIQQQRADTYAFKANNPNHVIKEDEKGHLIAINPQNNSVTYITDADGQPIKGNELSDYDRINLQIKGQKEVAAVRGAEARKTEGVRHVNRESEIHTAGDEARKTKSTAPGTSGQDMTEETVTTVTDNEGKPVGTRRTTRSKFNNMPGKVTMIAPNGQEKQVDPSEVEHYKEKGAKVKGEPKPVRSH